MKKTLAPIWNQRLFAFTASYERIDKSYRRIEIDPPRIGKWSVSLHASSFGQLLLFLFEIMAARSTPPFEKGVSSMLLEYCSMSRILYKRLWDDSFCIINVVVFT